MKNKKNLEALLYSAVGLAVMFVILIAVNVIAGFVKTRADLTAEKMYTLTPGTKAILKKLDTPVKIRFYCTQGENEMPVMLKSYARRVEDLLSEYRQASNGKITVQKLDPKPDSDAETSAGLDGVEGQPINTGDKIYLGLAISCLDNTVAIPFLAPDKENLLEYDISRHLTQVITPTKPIIGVMSALPVFGSPMNPMMAMRMGQQQQQEPWIFLNELKQRYTVKQVEMTADRIEDDIKVLVVIHPRDISDSAQFAIDQFVLRGGNLIAFLDPLSVIDNRGPGMNPLQRAASSGSTLDKLIKAWGLEFDNSKVVADKTFLSQINRGGRAEPAPAVLSLTRQAANTNDVTTSQVDNMLVPFAGVFTGTPVAGLKQDVLLKTSDKSQLIEKMMAEFAGDQINRDFSPTGKEFALAVRLSGKFKTAFPEGKPADKAGEKKDEEKPPAAAATALKESSKDSFVILFGDTDMLYDQFCAQVQNIFGQRLVFPNNDNLGLLQNLVDQMSGDSDLIGLRSRATANRPFTVVRKIQAEAEDRSRDKLRGLQTSLEEAQRKINELQTNKDKNQRFILSPEQQKELANFRAKENETKKELKDVRKSMRRDIDALENRLKWLNIAAMPFLVTVSGVALAVIKRRKTAAR